MSVFVCGIGAVSPAGWGVAAMREALRRGEPAPMRDLARPGWTNPLCVRTVPPPSPRPSFLGHARLRRTSPIAHYAVAAALEALGTSPPGMPALPVKERLGVVFCVMSGCVNYSRRFYDETLKNPATASPLVFPETVFNAPASHLSSLISASAENYTLVGDPAIFLQGVALAADWLLSERVDGCVVIGAEEMDWLTTDAFRLFHRRIILGEGAGAVYLRRNPTAEPAVQLEAITEPSLFFKGKTRAQAVESARRDLGPGQPTELLCDGVQGLPRLDRDEQQAWQDWKGPRISPKVILGDGRMAAAAWQCVAAIDELQQNRHPAASVSVAGCNQQAIAGRFVRCV